MDLEKNMEIVYPHPKKTSMLLSRLRFTLGWVFLVSSGGCLIANYVCKGKAWSLVSVWGMYMVWTLVLKQPLVEKNVISQGVKLLITSSIMLILIDVFLYPGWAHFVIPIVWFGALTVLGALFFVNVSKQRHNLMPLIWVTAAAVAAAAVALFVYKDTSWPMIVLGSVAAALLIASVIVLRMQFIVELKKRFHI